MTDDPAGLPGLSFEELQNQLGSVYHLQNLADVPNDEEVDAMLDKMVRRVFRLKGMPESIDKNITTYFANELWKGVVEGYGNDLFSVDFDTPDYEMLRRLQTDIFHFSAAKNYQQLAALSRALTDAEGKLRSWTDFKNAAYTINQDHVKKWLRAEYDMSVASSQMASKWTSIEADKETLKLLVFDAVNDERTTPVCHSLDGVTRPVDDHFWDIYYPPNHWGCRSSVRQSSIADITPMEKVHTPENMPALFKTNLAKNGRVFPKDHPYYTGLPHQVGEQADKLLKDASEQ